MDFRLPQKKIKASISLAIQNNLSVCFVTEDTTRSRPEDLESLYLTAIDAGAKRICICDTVGHATPNGVFNLVKYVQGVLQKKGLNDIQIDFHGHMDRGLDLWNSLTALIAGANRVHGCALGLGERSGNVSIGQLLVNLKLLGWISTDLKYLKKYAYLASKAMNFPIPNSYPVFGKDAFSTATGVHAAAISKALKNGQDDIADKVYSSVPASWVGRKQRIQIGPMSGKSCVIFWLRQNNILYDEMIVNGILNIAKSSTTVLSDRQILDCIFKNSKKLGSL